MAPKIIVSEDGVRYPADYAEAHGIKAARTIDTTAERVRTHTSVGSTVEDDQGGHVITAGVQGYGLVAPAGAAEATPDATPDAGPGSITLSEEQLQELIQAEVQKALADFAPAGAEGEGGDAGTGGAVGDSGGPSGPVGTTSRRAGGKAGATAGK